MTQPLESAFAAPVAIAGAGLTGASWAGLFAAAGLTVRIFDIREEALEPALDGARSAARFLTAHNLADADAAERGLQALTATSDASAAFSGVGHVQECVREDLQVKRELFALADLLTPPHALIATSSSGLQISQIQTAAASPQRTLAAHPYNPPHLVPLVELAPGSQTAPEAMARARAFYLAVGKEPVVLSRDIPGYVVNRISAALWREAVELVRTGVVTVAELDRAICTGPGLRWAAMGPHLIYDLGGGRGGIRGHVDHLAGVKENMLRDLATWVEFPPDTADVLAAGLPQEKAELLASAATASAATASAASASAATASAESASAAAAPPPVAVGAETNGGPHGGPPSRAAGEAGPRGLEGTSDTDDYAELCRLRDELLAAFVRERRRIIGRPASATSAAPPPS